jgi:hypothetical protein
MGTDGDNMIIESKILITCDECKAVVEVETSPGAVVFPDGWRSVRYLYPHGNCIANLDLCPACSEQFENFLHIKSHLAKPIFGPDNFFHLQCPKCGQTGWSIKGEVFGCNCGHTWDPKEPLQIEKGA